MPFPTRTHTTHVRALSPAGHGVHLFPYSPACSLIPLLAPLHTPAPLRTHAPLHTRFASAQVHGPMEVPAEYLEGACNELVPADYPTRKIYCGMVRAVDASIKNITDTYKKLGLWNDTVIILTGDNGGIPSDGGNNYPLRGNKATALEGGVRSIAFISGAGLSDAVKG